MNGNDGSISPGANAASWDNPDIPQLGGEGRLSAGADVHRRAGVNNRHWSAGASQHFSPSSRQTFFKWPIWLLENDHGDV
ncbi:hypothetical protein WG907_00600 [Sphingobium sp. AN558]|uniref:hypothetical protein n=1 Tax=Sphingobium sp. AN558 TaxID=3133442 RepID=UPI0030C3BCD1